MTEQSPLVEHFFRHEYGRLVAVLVRTLGARHLELAEDSVQEAMRRALRSWGLGRVPDQPAAWLLQVARRLAVDQLRRARLHHRFLAGQPPGAGDEIAEAEPVQLAGEIGDEPLRLLFLCCHPEIPAESGVALALKTVAGFGTREIATALLVPETTVQKRIERARVKLRELALELEPLHHPWMKRRLDAVRAAIYLLFNEGYLSARAESPIRQDLCDEALRLARLLSRHLVGNDPETHAMAALICFHAARAAARVDSAGALILLGEQDRSAWNWELVREGMDWMARSAVGDALSRYHLEAAIAWEHCRATSTEATDWEQIVQLYEHLASQVGGPAIELNRAVAESRCRGPQAALQRLLAVPAKSLPEPWPLWHAVLGQLHWQAGKRAAAIRHFEQALDVSESPAEKQIISSRLAILRGTASPSWLDGSD